MKKNAILLAVALSLGGASARADGGPGSCPPAAPNSCFEVCKQKCASWLFWQKGCCKKEKACVKKECVRVPDVKKKTNVEYDFIEEDICKSKCACCALGKKGCTDGQCDSCDKGGKCKDCGKVRCRRKLVKKFVTEECCTTKCIPVCKPECETPYQTGPCNLFPGASVPLSTTPPGPGAEVLPHHPGEVTPMKK